MSDLNQDPYAGIETEEERQLIYRSLQTQHEQNTQEYERKKKVYDDLSLVWDDQRNIQLEADARFHKNILMIAAGSFGVSFAFVNQIVPLNNAFQTNFLIWAWISFGISIMLTIIDPFVTSFIQDKLLNNIEKNIERGYEGKPYTEINKRLVMLPTRILNCLAFGFFTVGVICLLYFVYINIAIK